MRLAPLAALLLAAAPAAAGAYDPFEDEPPGGEERKRLLVTAWGGGLTGAPGSGRHGGSLGGGEVAWSFDSLDLGVQALAAQLEEGRARQSPVLLLRLGQRFETRGGAEAVLTLGMGAARLDRWQGWFQVGLGGRVPLGPLFLAAELAFEQNDLIRLAGGVGLRF